ncbi:MAG: hypothetical protein ACO1NT_11255 [Parapedobacter sp.]
MVIDAVASTPCRNKAVTEARDALLNYYRNNAHRTIIQKRLKQSGQRGVRSGRKTCST